MEGRHSEAIGKNPTKPYQKKNKTKQNKKNMIVLPVEVVLLENLKMQLKFTIYEVTASTIYM